MPKYFSGVVLLRITHIAETPRPMFSTGLDPVGPSYQQMYTEISVSGEIPEGAEESLEELVLEEALAAAMSKRQGDE